MGWRMNYCSLARWGGWLAAQTGWLGGLLATAAYVYIAGSLA